MDGRSVWPCRDRVKRHALEQLPLTPVGDSRSAHCSHNPHQESAINELSEPLAFDARVTKVNAIKELNAIILVLVFGASHVLASPKGVAGDSSSGDWVYVDHDLAGTRYSHLEQITTENVSQLVKASAYSFPDKNPSQTPPTVSEGRIDRTTSHNTLP